MVYSLPCCSGDRSNYFHSSYFAEANLCCVTHCPVLPLGVSSSSCPLQAPSPAVLTSHPPMHRQRLIVRFMYSVSEHRATSSLPDSNITSLSHNHPLFFPAQHHCTSSLPPTWQIGPMTGSLCGGMVAVRDALLSHKLSPVAYLWWLAQVSSLPQSPGSRRRSQYKKRCVALQAGNTVAQPQAGKGV